MVMFKQLVRKTYAASLLGLAKSTTFKFPVKVAMNRHPLWQGRAGDVKKRKHSQTSNNRGGGSHNRQPKHGHTTLRLGSDT